MSSGRGWYSRGYLPHLDLPGRQFLTWRLADSVPGEVIERWMEELRQEPDEVRIRELNRRIEQFADAGHGSCVLRDPRVARIVMQVLLHDHRKRYDLQAWVIMPNHVHVILEPIAPNSLSRIVKALKGVSSKDIGKLLGQRGQLWQIDYFDRRVRDDEHYKRLVRYIEWNPVKAGLCFEPKAWFWSSAHPDRGRRLDADQGSADP